MRALTLLLLLMLTLTARAADQQNDDDVDDLSPPRGRAGQLKGIDEEIQRDTVDPEAEPEEPEEFADPYADDPDADDDILPEDRPDADLDADPPPTLEPADMLEDLPKKKGSKMFPNVLESPLKDSPLKEDADSQ